MRASEFIMENTILDMNRYIPFATEIRKLLGTDKFNFPYIHFVESVTWLGMCKMDPKLSRYKTEIKISSLLGYENEIKRVLAHELCHEAEYFLYWLPTLEEYQLQHKDAPDEILLKELWTDQHSFAWHKYADKVNSVYGTNYVTPNSDKSFKGFEDNKLERDKKILASIPRYFNAGKRRGL